jgi:hypothetical protein
VNDKPDQVVVYRLPRWGAALLIASFCIAAGASTALGVTVVRSNGEHGRQCATVEEGVDLALEGIYNLPQRSDLPPRTAADNARRRQAFAAVLDAVDTRIREKC